MSTNAAPAPAAPAAPAPAAPAPAAAAAPAAPAAAPAAPSTGAPDPAATPPAPAAPKAPDPAAAGTVKLDLKLPAESKLDAKVLEEVGTLASAAGITQEHAQKVVDLANQVASTQVTKALEEFQTSQVRGGALWEQRNNQYKADALKDAELGAGDPAKLEAVSALAQRALATFAPKEMIDLIGQAGLESHPGLLKMLVKIGKSMKEDEFIVGTPAAAGNKARAADVLYGAKK